MTPAFPPGPRNDLFAVRRLINNPARYLKEQSRRYGDISSISLGHIRFHLINHPELVRKVFQDDAGLFKRPSPKGQYRYQKRFGTSITTTDAEEHRTHRRMLTGSFSRAMVQHYRQAALQRSRRMRDQWQDGQILDMRAAMADLTAQVGCSALFSEDAGEEIRAILNRLHHEHARFAELRPLQAGIATFLPFGVAHRQYGIEDELDQFILRTIRKRRESGGERNDILATLMSVQDAQGRGLTEEMIRGQIVSLFWASQETTTDSLSWTWYVLDRYPAIRQRVSDELRQVAAEDPEFEQLDRLVYLRQVVSETMRLYPPIWTLNRVPINDLDIEHEGRTYHLGAEEITTACPYLLHRDPRFWDDPLTFNPDRFAPGEAEKISRYTYFPFGIGAHRCIGEGFAWMEILTTLSTLLYRWQATSEGQKPAVQRSGVTLYPLGLNLKIHSRQP